MAWHTCGSSSTVRIVGLLIAVLPYVAF